MAKANAKDKPASAALHPPYFEMIADAISSLKERNGSSQQAIAKFMEEKHSKVLTPNFRKVLSVQLKKFVRSERLLKVKNSFKLTSMEKLKLTIKETQKAKNPVAKAKQKADKITEKAIKTKRLSQVKTPDALRKANKDANDKFPSSSAGKRKRLTQLNSPMPTNRATK